MRKCGSDMEKLKAVIELLAQAAPLPTAYRDHQVSGQWDGFRDLHIEPDWLLIYRVVGNEVQLARTGTHSDIFN